MRDGRSSESNRRRLLLLANFGRFAGLTFLIGERAVSLHFYCGSSHGLHRPTSPCPRHHRRLGGERALIEKNDVVLGIGRTDVGAENFQQLTKWVILRKGGEMI